MKLEPNKENEWRKLLKKFKVENTTVNKFCESHNVTVPSYYYWRKRIDEIDNSVVAQKASFIKVREIPNIEVRETNLTIETNHIKINVPIDFNIDHLKKLISAVQSID